MVFSSVIFLILFLPSVMALYFLTPSIKLKNLVLILFSVLFYAWGEFIQTPIMIATVAIAYVCGILIEKTVSFQRRFFTLAIGVAALLSFLLYFKYFNFFIQNLNHLCSILSLPYQFQLPDVSLPVGISFFSFQAISYVVDVYRGHTASQRNFLNLFLYISFFPQLIAGPIVRYVDIAREIVRRTTTLEDFSIGARRFVFGLAQKVLIADVMGRAADQVFELSFSELSFGVAWFGALAYTLQIYFDFNGYSNMAIGLGRIFGFRFLENFNYPYAATSITDFWRRWHISLSSWFRDYLYIPLGGNRKGFRRTYLNLYIVFILCGLWHGASWTFAAWGVYHGSLLVFEKSSLWDRTINSSPTIVKHCYTLVFVICGWVVFRADTFGGALKVLFSMTGLKTSESSAFPLAALLSFETIVSVCLGVAFSVPFMRRGRSNSQDWLQPHYPKIEYAAFVILLILSTTQIAGRSFNPFIYFRF